MVLLLEIWHRQILFFIIMHIHIHDAYTVLTFLIQPGLAHIGNEILCNELHNTMLGL